MWVKKVVLVVVLGLLLPGWGSCYDIQGDLGVKGKVTIQDSSSKPPLNVTERSSAPSSPASGDMYLDNGSNTASGSPGWRRYTGSAWEDVSAGGGSSMTYPGAGIALSTGSAWGTSVTNNSTNWNTAYSERLRWDGGSTGLTAATGRASLGLADIYTYGITTAGTPGYVWKSKVGGGKGEWAIDQTGAAAWTEVDTYAELRDALQANTAWVMVTDNITLAGTITGGVSASSRLSFVYGKKITLSSYSLPIYGELDAGPYQVFVQSSTTNKAYFPNRPPVEVFVEWWGGKGDDSTDCTNAFNYAIASLPSGEGGGTIRLLANATYRISSVVSIQKGGVYIRGEGLRSTVIKKTGTSTANWLEFTCAGSTGTTKIYGGGVSGVLFLASSLQTGGACIYVKNVNRFRVEQVEATGWPGAGIPASTNNPYDGLILYACWNPTVIESRFSVNHYALQLSGYKSATGQSQYHVVDPTLSNLKLMGYYGLYIDDAEGLYSWNVGVESCTSHGVYIYSTGNAKIVNLFFNTLYSDTCSGNAVRIENSSSDWYGMHGIQFANSWFSGAGYSIASGSYTSAQSGLYITSTNSNIRDIYVNNCQIVTNGKHGIEVNSSYPSKLTITDSVFRGNSRYSDESYSGIYMDGSINAVLISNNFFGWEFATHKYSIQTTVGTGYFWIVSNNLTSAYATAAMSLNYTGSPNVLSDNLP